MYKTDNIIFYKNTWNFKFMISSKTIPILLLIYYSYFEVDLVLEIDAESYLLWSKNKNLFLEVSEI